MKFNELNLTPEMLKAINDCNYEEATYIQSECIPLILQDKDVIGQSQTGTGKTAAFAIPIIEKINVEIKKKPQVIILTPTRELALQITEEIRKFSKYKEGCKTVSIYGGSPIQRQIQDLKNGCSIVVGCPGRILDHIRRKTLKLNECSKIVLDEADEMLNMGFREDIELILKELPEDRQTVLFSATMPKAILELTKEYQTSPVHIKSQKKEMTAARIEQIVYECKQKDKQNLLLQLIDLKRPKIAIVFCNTKKMVDDLTSDLVAKGYSAAALHGDMKQEARSNVMKRFKEKKINILIATDVAARGIDVDNMDVVYNFDFPQETEYYVHRIGRTGRAGNQGMAITLLTPRQTILIKELKRITNASIEMKELPTADEIYEIKMNQIYCDIQEMLSKPVTNDIEQLVTDIHHQHVSYKDLATALLNNMFAESLIIPIQPVKKSEKSNNKKRSVYETIELNIGRKNKIKPSDLTNVLSKAINVSARDIGNIDIKENNTLISLQKNKLSKLSDYFKQHKLKGVSIKIKSATNKKNTRKRNNNKRRSSR
ncbi:MAG: DEAD/DEAH box helicase [Anaerorhabdus sp.]